MDQTLHSARSRGQLDPRSRMWLGPTDRAVPHRARIRRCRRRLVADAHPEMPHAFPRPGMVGCRYAYAVDGPQVLRLHCLGQLLPLVPRAPTSNVSDLQQARGSRRPAPIHYRSRTWRNDGVISGRAAIPRELISPGISRAVGLERFQAGSARGGRPSVRGAHCLAGAVGGRARMKQCPGPNILLQPPHPVRCACAFGRNVGHRWLR